MLFINLFKNIGKFMSKLVKYPKKYLERFFTRNGNGWALTRGQGITLKIRRPGEVTDTPKPIPPEIIPVHLSTKKYTISANGGMFTVFRFGDIVLSMQTFEQVTETLNQNETLKTQGFVFETLGDTFSIIVKNDDVTIPNFEWQYTQEVAITENIGVQVQFANMAKYDTAEFIATIVEEPEQPVPTDPVEPPPIVVPPPRQPIRKSLETYEFSILLDTGRRLSRFNINGLEYTNVSLNEIFYMLSQQIPALQVELLNDGNILRITTDAGVTFNDVEIFPEIGQRVGIQEFADGEVQEYDSPGIIYETLTLLAKEKPNVEEPLKIKVSYHTPNNLSSTSDWIIILEDGAWKEELKSTLANNPNYSVAIDNSNVVTIRNIGQYHWLPLTITTNKPDEGELIATLEDINHVSDTLSFRPGDVVKVELHANTVMDKFVMNLPETMAKFKFGNIDLENSTADTIKNVIRTHDNLDYETLDGEKIAIVNTTNEPLRIDKVSLTTGVDTGVIFYHEDSNIRHNPKLFGLDEFDVFKLNSVTLNNIPITYVYEVTVDGQNVYRQEITGEDKIDVNALSEALTNTGKVTTHKNTDDDNRLVISNIITSEQRIIIGKWKHVDDTYREYNVNDGNEVTIEIHDSVNPNFRVEFSPIIVEEPETEPTPNTSDENCYLLVEVKQLHGYRGKDEIIPLPNVEFKTWKRNENVDFTYNEVDDVAEYTRDVVHLLGKTKTQIDQAVEAIIRKYTLDGTDIITNEDGYLVENTSKTNAWQIKISKHCLTSENNEIPDYKFVPIVNSGDDIEYLPDDSYTGE